MAKSSSVSARARASSKRDGNSRGTASSRRDGDGNPVLNEVLLALPRGEFETVVPKLEFVRLKLHQVLHEAGESLKSMYFCNSGMFSILNVMPDGKSVEVGLIGKEGVSATPLAAGFRTSHTRAVVQAEATAFRMSADALRAALPRMSQAGAAAEPLCATAGGAGDPDRSLQPAARSG